MAVVKGANAALVLQGGSAFAGTAVGDRLAFAEAMRAQCVRGEPGAIRRYNESRSEATIRLGVAAGMQVTMSIFFIVEHAGSPDSSSLLIDEFLLATADQSVGSSPARKAIEEAQSEELMGQLDESKISLDKKIRDQENRESAVVFVQTAHPAPRTSLIISSDSSVCGAGSRSPLQVIQTLLQVRTPQTKPNAQYAIRTWIQLTRLSTNVGNRSTTIVSSRSSNLVAVSASPKMSQVFRRSALIVRIIWFRLRCAHSSKPPLR